MKTQYIQKIDIISWNYNDDLTHVTNNSDESYNCKLKKLFKVKPTFFKLLYELRLEENDISNTYEKRKSGLIGHEVRRNTHIIKKIENLNSLEENIRKMPSKTEEDKAKISAEWFNIINIFGKNIYF